MPYRDLKKRRAASKRSKDAHREEIRAQQRDYYRRYRDAHPEEARARWRMQANEWRRTHPETVKIAKKRWYTANQKEICAKKRADRIAHPEVERNRDLKYSYGLTPEAYEVLWIVQDGKCAICQCEMTRNCRQRSSVHVDHDHLTGKVRGLLCQLCNISLGGFRDSFTLLAAARRYLAAGV